LDGHDAWTGAVAITGRLASKADAKLTLRVALCVADGQTPPDALSNARGPQRFREREIVARRAVVRCNRKHAVIVFLRLLMPANCVQGYSGAIERFDVLRVPFKDGTECCEGFCMLLSREQDLRETDLAVDIGRGYHERLAKRGVGPVEVATAQECPPEIDPGLRCGRLTFRDPPVDVCGVERVSVALGGLRQPRQGRTIEIGTGGRRIG
jgi:hypothetical protein